MSKSGQEDVTSHFGPQVKLFSFMIWNMFIRAMLLIVNLISSSHWETRLYFREILPSQRAPLYPVMHLQANPVPPTTSRQYPPWRQGFGRHWSISTEVMDRKNPREVKKQRKINEF